MSIGYSIRGMQQRLHIFSMTDNVAIASSVIALGYDADMERICMEEVVRLGVVSFLNTVPIIDGVSIVEGFTLIPRVPSELIGSLDRGEVDIALASSIDYQRSKVDLRILPVGVLSSDGETLTVRLCSKRPLEEVTEVHCDTDSHTSVALLQIILQHRFGLTPTIVSTTIASLVDAGTNWPETVLIIGDKVVTNSIDLEYPYRLDLGQAWKDQTDLPFVFAAWFGRADLDQQLVRRTSMLLDRQLRFNMNRIEQVVSSEATVRGWETDLAYQYLTKHMQYVFSPKHVDSLELFYDLAASCGVIDTVRPLRFYSD